MRRKARDVPPGGAVALVRRGDAHGGLFRDGEHRLVLGVPGAGEIEHGNNELRFLRRGDGALHAERFHGVGCFAHARGVGQPQRHAAEKAPLRERVARRAGDVGDDGALKAEQRVEQRRFSGVRAAENGRAHALFKKLPAGKRGEQRFERADRRIEHGGVFRERERRYILVRIVEHRVIVRADVREILIDLLRAAGDRPAELTGGVSRRERRFRVDDIDDGLRLREIHAPVQKGALGELTRRCLPRAEGEESFQRGAQHDGRAMALKLCGVLAGVASRRAGERAETEIERPSLLVEQLAVNELPVAVLRHGLSVRRAEKRVHQRYGKGTRYAHDADGGNACAGRNGGNGITHLSSFFAQGSFLLSS